MAASQLLELARPPYKTRFRMRWPFIRFWVQNGRRAAFGLIVAVEFVKAGFYVTGMFYLLAVGIKAAGKV